MGGIFGVFEVKVHALFSGTQGFPARRDGRYMPVVDMGPENGNYTPVTMNSGLIRSSLDNLSSL